MSVYDERKQSTDERSAMVVELLEATERIAKRKCATFIF